MEKDNLKNETANSTNTVLSAVPSQKEIEQASFDASYKFRDEPVQRMDDYANGFEEGVQWLLERQRNCR
jgi:hypothetical protein